MLQAAGRFSSRIPVRCRYARHKSTLLGKLHGVLALRREDASVWERRAPLSPAHCRELVNCGVKVIIQPSNRRAYTSQEYAQAGVVEQEDISDADLIIGVKQVPIDHLHDKKAYCFFSHTIKAQDENMPMLDAILEKKIRLMDYEKLVDENGQRLVAFGVFAGVAGMFNILHGLGLRLLALGHHTPFLHIGPPHNYRNSEMGNAAVRDAGYEIALDRLPKSIGPLTFVFTGAGNVSQGAQQVFQHLPHEYVAPEHLEKAAKHGAMNKVYGCVVNKKDYLRRKTDGGFDGQEFNDHPERYVSVFAEKIAPYTSCIVNGIFWVPRYPRLITIPEAKRLIKPLDQPWIRSSPGCPPLPHRLLALSDISADPGGSIQFMQKCTSIDQPFCLYDADDNMNVESFAGPGVLVCSIDNMPTQLPREATDFFGSLLLPYIPDMLSAADTSGTTYDTMKTSDVVKRAVIASDGMMTPPFEYITALRQKKSAKLSTVSSAKRVLILGAGHVAAPVVDYLCRDEQTSVTVASQYMKDLQTLTNHHESAHPLVLDIAERPDDLEKSISGHDCVISLLPAPFHCRVGELCLKHKRNLVTASYTSPEMRQLSERAGKEAGLLFLNEFGLDPGIDHMLAARTFDDFRSEGCKIESFVSYCGGLPAPDYSNNPLRYKFSWAPRNVFANMLLPAQYLWNNEVVKVAPDGHILDAGLPVDFLPGFALEAIPNRDSLSYKEEYGLTEAHTILRGTLRYTGFLQNMKALFKLGLIDAGDYAALHPKGTPITWRQLITQLLNLPNDTLVDKLKSDLLDTKLDGDRNLLSVVEGLGLLSDDIVSMRGNLLDALADQAFDRLHLRANERDVCIMRHDIVARHLDGKREARHITLCAWGDETYSGMARTVGFTTGIATKMLLDGEIPSTGLILPTMPEMYEPVLKRLRHEGVKADEVTIQL